MCFNSVDCAFASTIYRFNIWDCFTSVVFLGLFHQCGVLGFSTSVVFLGLFHQCGIFGIVPPVWYLLFAFHFIMLFCEFQYTVKFTHAVTSIKQSPVLKGHIFLVLSKKISYELSLF